MSKNLENLAWAAVLMVAFLLWAETFIHSVSMLLKG